MNVQYEDSLMIKQALSAEMLDLETEVALCRAWREHRDEDAMQRLVAAHVRISVKTARKYRNFNFPMSDLIQEGNIGLLKAADRFDLEHGVRFSTYAMWWVRAEIQAYVMRHHSIVKLGSTANQKSLFFNLKKTLRKVEEEAFSRGEVLSRDQSYEAVSKLTSIPVETIQMVHGRMSSPDLSLNSPLSSDEGESSDWINMILDDAPQASEIYEASDTQNYVRSLIFGSLTVLKERERYVLEQRILNDPPRTLDSLGQELNLSRERIRQIEVKALSKLRTSLFEKSDAINSVLQA